MAEERASQNLTWHGGLVSAERRGELLGQRGCVVWLTGLSGSGKSTLARALENRLISDRRAAYVLDGDNLRHGLNRDLGFSPEDRDENIRRVGEVAALMADAGLITITAFISPYRTARQQAREAAGAAPFIEVFLDVPIEVCRQRDPKGLYARAQAGKIDQFTGIDAPYEPPKKPELEIDTSIQPVPVCLDLLYDYLVKRGVLKTDSSAQSCPAAKGGTPNT
jgi:adenylylsulfate kinase